MNGLFSKEFLQSIGIKLDEQTLALFGEHIEETLNERVITEITDSLSEEQLIELSHFDTARSEQLQTWLQTNVPDLDAIVQDELAIIAGEIAENSDKLSLQP